MPRVREYTQQVEAQGIIRAGATPADFGAGIGEGLQVLGRGLEIANRGIREERERTNMADANAKIPAFELQAVQTMQEMQQNAQPGAPEFANNFLRTFQERAEQVVNSAGDEKSRAFLRQRLDGMRTQYGARAMGFESEQRGVFRAGKQVEAVQSAAALVNQNPDLYEAQVQERVAAIEADTAIPQTNRSRMTLAARSTLAESALEGRRARDPIGLTRALLPSAVDAAYGRAQPAAPAAAPAARGSNFRSAVETVLKFEGGFTPSDGASGAPANFGINQRANPDVDVKNLTRDQAIQLYKDRYWDAIGGDNLEPRMALALFDTAVNMGVGAARNLAAQAGGDVNRLMELRRARYQQIAQNPAQAPNLRGWMNRMDTLQRELGAVPVTDSQGVPVPQIATGQAAPGTKLPDTLALQPPLEVPGIPEWKDLTLDQRQKAMAQSITDFNSRVVVDREMLIRDRRDMHANLVNGNRFDRANEVQARYAQAYGPEMAARMVEEDRRVAQLGTFTQTVRGKTDAEIASMMPPAPQANATANEYEMYERFQRAAAADREQLRKNPNEYVMQFDGAVRSAVQTLQQAQNGTDPQAIARATQNMITASLAAQRRLGVAQPQVLSETQEKQLVAQVENIAASGQNVATQIQQLYANYGQYAPSIAAQVGRKVGGMMQVIGSGIDPNAATLLVEANRSKDDLKKSLGDNVQKLDDAVVTQLSTFATTLAPLPRGGADVLATYGEQVGLLAMMRMRRFGESQNDAVKKSYDSLIGSRYNFVGEYRIPVAFDRNVVSRQASQVRAFVNPNELMVPPSSTIGNQEDAGRAYAEAVRNSGRWATMTMPGPDGQLQEGLVLTVPTLGGHTAVARPDGKPFFLTFPELVQRAEAQKRPASPTFRPPVDGEAGAAFGLYPPVRRGGMQP